MPTDTSGGTFNTLKDVGQQDAAIASHWPILDDRRQTLADTVVLNEETNEKNRADYEDAVQDVKQAFEDVINPPKKSGWKFWK